MDIPGNFELIQNGETFSREQIAFDSQSLAAKLQTIPGSRVAIDCSIAANAVVALIALSKSNCELVLLRGKVSPSDSAESSLKFDAYLTDQLKLHIWSAVQNNNQPPPPPSLVVFTSGTTGKAKGARYNFEDLILQIRTPRDSDQIRWLLTYHPGSFAGLQVVLTVLLGGGTLITTSEQYYPSLGTAALKSHPTHISGTPTFWRAFLAHLGDDARDIPLRHAVLGGETVDQGVLDSIRKSFPNANIVHIYATTEAGTVFAVKDRRSGFPSRWLDEGVSDIRLRIRDGILEVKSNRSMQEYVESHPDGKSLGWITTNDRIELVGDRAFFAGREDSVINVGGLKVRSEYVEDKMRELPEILDVEVYGKSNPVLGNVVAANVVLNNGFDEIVTRSILIRYLEQNLLRHERPMILNFVTEIQTSATGKKVRR